MPVTAKLSRKFYETFGDEIVDELVEWFNQLDATYRGDPLSPNELDLSRFDSMIDQRITQLDAKLEKRFAHCEIKFDQQLSNFQAKVDDRLVQLDARWVQRLNELDSKLNQRVARLSVDLVTQRTELVKSMFVFSVGTLFPLAALILILMISLR